MAGDKSVWGALASFGPVAGMKFGPGANGRIGTVILGLCIVLGIVAFPMVFVEPVLAVAILGMIMVLGGGYMGAAFWYANCHPELSAMDSVHVAKVLMQDGAMRAPPGSQLEVSQPSMIDVTPVPNPSLANGMLEGGADA